jgi:class 3 adenylate cyclase/tetratricopeptide (TPR) repeat protein
VSGNSGKLDRYAPRGLLRRLVDDPAAPVKTLDGTVVFIDISGFTRLSERLARYGHEGAEHLADSIDACFSALLADAYAGGGSLWKFGGDALLLWFEGSGHAERGCQAAIAMRRTLRSVGRIRTGPASIILRMSVGVHSGSYDTFLVGGSHREYVIAGPAASEVVAIEAAASAGQILLSRATAERLPDRCLGDLVGPGVVLARAPTSRAYVAAEPPAGASDDHIAGCLPTALRAHILGGVDTPEHRTATVAFVQFGQFDALIAERGGDDAAVALDELVRIVQEAADRYEVALLGSDVMGGGGKLLLAAGAPRAAGDDEERMLLAARQMIDAGPRLPVRIGINRGHVFAGEIGPPYRRTYTVMGDDVNLGARLMARAPWGEIYATGGVLERSQTKFVLTEVEPFMAKGKTRPVHASSVGPARRAAQAASVRRRMPLIGRQPELAVVREAVQRAQEGIGGMVEIVGETGSGKSRLLSEARELAAGMGFVHSTGEAYTQTTPYVLWRDTLRQLLGLSWNDTDEVVLDRLHAEITANHPDLLPWLPLLAIVIDAEAPTTREVDELSADFRTDKLHEVVLRFLAQALRVPTLVQIEHAHLMDEASSALLGALATELPTSSWVVLVTRRDSERGFIAAEGAATRLELGPLTREEAFALAEATPEANHVPPHMIEMAVERSGGSPEFLLDLLAAAAAGTEELPDSVDSAAMARIDALDPGDRMLVRRAAVLGVSFHPRRLQHVLAADAAPPDEAAWQRLNPMFASDPDGHIRFKRPALREVAYEGLPFRLRRELHAALARALERDLGTDIDADPAVLSLHFILAGDHARARKYAVMGAERATDRFAHADASRLYRRALEAVRGGRLEPRALAELWEGLGEALRRTGEREAAKDALMNARRLFEGRPVDEARLLYRLAVAAQRSGGTTAAIRWANRGLRVLDGVNNDEASRWRARLLSDLAVFRQRQGRSLEAERLCRLAIAEAESVGELRALARACNGLDYALVETGRAKEAIHSGRALEIYRQLGDPEQESAVLNNLGMFAYFRGEWDEAIDLYRRQAECSERAGNPADAAYTDCNVGEILSDQGHFDEASRHLRRARRVWRSTGDRPGVSFANLQLGRVAVRAGRYEEGLALLEAASDELRGFNLDAYADFGLGLVAEAEALSGDPRRALEIADGLMAAADRYLPLLQRARGIALGRLGEWEAATVELEASFAAAREREAHYDIAATLDALDAFAGLDAEAAAERDEIVARLRIVALPRPLAGAQS